MFTIEGIASNYSHLTEQTRSSTELFSQRVIPHWNRLPAHVVEADTVNTFKNRLDKEWGN